MRGIGLQINKKKTKVMKPSRNGSRDSLSSKTGSVSIQEVDEFNYLGSIITKDGHNKNDIKKRLAQIISAFYQEEPS